MEFLNPAALFGLLALPLLLIPYLVRRKPQRLIFSSILLFSEVSARARARPWGRLRLPPIFFLQLLLLILLILMLGEPVFSVRPTKVALVLDNSASMQALEERRTRFALAQEEASRLLGGLATGATVDLYLTVPSIARTHTEPMSAAEAARALSRLRPYDLPDNVADYADVFDGMARDQGYDRIYFLTDLPARSQTALTRVVTVGQPKSNLALNAFQIGRSSITNSRLQATIEIMSYSGKEEKARVVLRGRGNILGSRELLIPAGKSVEASFEGLPFHPYYQAEIATTDPLVMDNHRFAVPPGSQRLKILAVSPRPQALTSLRAVPGLSLDLISPGDYPQAQHSDYSLEIFHFATPAELPRNPALFVLPPDQNPLTGLSKPVPGPVVSSWRDPHPLTRYVNFSLFRPTYARPLKPHTPGDIIIESPAGALAFAAQIRGERYLVVGFDPFPYLGRENLPVSIFTLNFLEWLFGSAGNTASPTGTALTFPRADEGDALTTPAGETIPLKAGATQFPNTTAQGIYRLSHAGRAELFAVNFDGANESDLRSPMPIEIGREAARGASSSVLFSFWPYLAALALLLFLVEWFLSAVAVGPAVRSKAKSAQALGKSS